MSPAKKLHYHQCSRELCGRIISCACDHAELDLPCKECRIGRLRAMTDVNRDPQRCCVDNSRPVMKDEIKTYLLAGTKPWFICRTCARTNGKVVLDHAAQTFAG